MAWTHNSIRNGVCLSKVYIIKMSKLRLLQGEEGSLQKDSPLSRPSVWHRWTSGREHDSGQTREWARGWPLCSYGPDYRCCSGIKLSRSHQNKRSSITYTTDPLFVNPILSLAEMAHQLGRASTRAIPSTPHLPRHQGLALRYLSAKPSQWPILPLLPELQQHLIAILGELVDSTALYWGSGLWNAADRFKLQLHSLLTWWPWANFLTALCLSFLNYQKEIVRVPTS